MAVRHAARLRAIRQEATPNLKWSSHAVTFLPVTRFDCPSPPAAAAAAARLPVARPPALRSGGPVRVRARAPGARRDDPSVEMRLCARILG